MDYEAKQFYQDERIARTYDAQFRSPFRLANLRFKLIDWGEKRAFEQLLGQIKPRDTVLDIACGTGRYTEVLLQHGYKVGGIDVSAQMLTIAHQHVGSHPDLLFLQEGDAEHLLFESAQFDGITCMRLYHRMPPAVRVEMLKETRRVAKEWCILFFGVSTPWLDARRWLRKQILGRISTPYPVSVPHMLSELASVGWRVADTAWVMHYLADGLLVLAK